MIGLSVWATHWSDIITDLPWAMAVDIGLAIAINWRPPAKAALKYRQSDHLLYRFQVALPLFFLCLAVHRNKFAIITTHHSGVTCDFIFDHHCLISLGLQQFIVLSRYLNRFPCSTKLVFPCSIMKLP